MPTIPYKKRRAQARRKAPNNTVYNSRRWRQLAALHKSLNPLCVSCAEKGIDSPAEVTDHITPINQGGAVYDVKNLQSLCNRCHARKSGREAHENKKQ